MGFLPPWARAADGAGRQIRQMRSGRYTRDTEKDRPRPVSWSDAGLPAEATGVRQRLSGLPVGLSDLDYW